MKHNRPQPDAIEQKLAITNPEAQLQVQNGTPDPLGEMGAGLRVYTF